MPGSVDRFPLVYIPTPPAGAGSAVSWDSLAGKEPLYPAQHRLPQQFSPKSREVMPDFLRWVLRRTTCRQGAGQW